MTRSKKHIFIINPTSGTGKYQEVKSVIDDYFKDVPSQYEVHYTEYVHHATELAQQYDDKHIVYSVGGDGTAHEVLNGLNKNVTMAVIPVGTGNDFWRMIDYEGDLFNLVIDTIEGEDHRIDIGLANGHRFLNCANIGIDAEVNKFVNNVRHQWFPRSIIYIYAAIIEAFRYKSTRIKTQTVNGFKEHSIVLTSFMNGKWYGGGFKSAPQADLKDGLLDVCLVEDMTLKRMFKLIPKYFKGEHLNYPEVTYQQVPEIIIEADRPIPLGCDGEIFEYDKIRISVDRAGLSLRLPKKAKI